MSSRSQLRLGQITGSFGNRDGGLIDTKTPNSAVDLASLALQSGSMVSVMNELLSSVKRVHGAAYFAKNNIGEIIHDANQLHLESGENSATAIHINASNAAGGIDIDAGTGGIAADSDGAIVFNSAGATDVNATGALTLDSDTSVALGTATSGVAVTIGHTTSEVTIGDNLTVTGDLTVSGVTTAIATVNLEVKDRLIGLNYESGSAEAVLGDAGLVVGNNGGDQKAFFWDNSETEFALVTTPESATDTALTIGKYEELRLGKTLYGPGGAFLSSSAGTEGLIVSSSAGDPIMLSANNGELIFNSDDSANDGVKVSLKIEGSEAKLRAGDAQQGLAMNASGSLNLGHAQGIYVTGSAFNVFQGTADSGHIKFWDQQNIDLAAGNSRYVGIKAPSDVDGAGANNSIDLILPVSLGTANQVLVTDGGAAEAALSWASVPLLDDMKKQSMRIEAAGLAAGTALDPSASPVVAADQAVLDLGVEDVNSIKTIDVFVNGQLLLTGSNAEVTAPATKDYRIETFGSNAATLKFGFDLELDDIVTVIRRA